MPVPATVNVVPGAELPVAAVSPVSLAGDIDLSLAQFLSGPTGSSSVPVGQSTEVDTSARGVNVTFHEAVCDIPAPSRVGETDPTSGTSSGVVKKFEEKSTLDSLFLQFVSRESRDELKYFSKSALASTEEWDISKVTLRFGKVSLGSGVESLSNSSSFSLSDEISISW